MWHVPDSSNIYAYTYLQNCNFFYQKYYRPKSYSSNPTSDVNLIVDTKYTNFKINFLTSSEQYIIIL